MALLRYGSDSSVCVELADGRLPDESGTPRGRPLADPQAAVAYAVGDPLDYPSLAASTTPGDRVVLALDRGLPQTAQIAAAAIRSLVAAGVDPDGITVLQPQTDIDADIDNPCRLLDEQLGDRVAVLRHNPADRRALAYLAAGDSGEPILISRAIHEADLVLPVGCLQCDSAAGYFGIHGSIFPLFSDQKTLARFRSASSLDQRSHQRRLADEADHVAWLLGINFTIQLVPAAGDGIMHVIAGQSDSVRRRGRELYRAAWSKPVLQRASLVVAAIEGGAGQQTWENLGRALAAAVPLVQDGGAIVVCCDLAAQPGPAVQQIASARSRDAALRQIDKHRPYDALSAALLARAQKQGTVYLLSRLDPALVEALDIIPIAGDDELARLSRQHQSCILLANAPQAMVTVEDEARGRRAVGR
jgi:nickel-dependent lactate racemase